MLHARFVGIGTQCGQANDETTLGGTLQSPGQGGAGLRYDGGQFVVNWKTSPDWSTPPSCRHVAVLFDGQYVGGADFHFSR